MIRRLGTHLRQHTVSYLALFVALGGTSYAATSLPANSVGTTQLRAGAVQAQDIGRLPAVRAYTTDPEQPLTDGTFAAVRLKQEQFDIGGMHTPDADEDTRIVAPRSGSYVVQATAVFAGGACGGPPRVALIQHHARAGRVTVDHTSSGTLCGEPTRVHAGGVVRMRAGEHLELMALQRSAPQVMVAGAVSAAYVGG